MTKSTLPAKISVAVIVIALYVGVSFYVKKDDTTTTEQVTETDTTLNTGTVQLGDYKDGTYAAIGNYVSPGGPEEITVTLTLKNDVVTATSMEVLAESPTSKNFQTQFKENYKQQVVGKKISELNLTKVSGSSLTPKGFNDAVAKIKADAEG